MGITLLAVLLAAASISAQAQSTPPTTKPSIMREVARGEFVVKLSPLAFEGQPDGSKIRRMSIDNGNLWRSDRNNQRSDAERND
jgi:hypothetical protein